MFKILALGFHMFQFYFWTTSPPLIMGQVTKSEHGGGVGGIKREYWFISTVMSHLWKNHLVSRSTDIYGCSTKGHDKVSDIH